MLPIPVKLDELQLGDVIVELRSLSGVIMTPTMSNSRSEHPYVVSKIRNNGPHVLRDVWGVDSQGMVTPLFIIDTDTVSVVRGVPGATQEEGT